jgi:ubiquinone/menaquinone biosynthesis C-methylase UbiE
MSATALKVSPIQQPRSPGDFTGLATDYAKYRSGYSGEAIKAITGLLPRAVAQSDCADVGAGTGIFTRQLAGEGFRTVTAVEPNSDMRETGKAATTNPRVRWREGSGEATGLEDSSVDLITMASSFHWVDFDRGVAEFHRILRAQGCFAALWNPRVIEANPLLVEIEAKARALAGDSTRQSSGLSGRAEQMMSLFQNCALFATPIYIEGRHTQRFTPEAYLGVWRSVNDWQVKLGPAGFSRFLDYVADRIAGLDAIETTYLTRAWIARKV